MKEQGKGKALIKLLLILIATIGFCFGGYKYIGDVKLGLDLAGGVSITYEANEEDPSQEDMDDTIYKLQRRAEGYSSESAVYQEGSNRINIDIPGVSDANAILSAPLISAYCVVSMIWSRIFLKEKLSKGKYIAIAITVIGIIILGASDA